MAVEKVRILVQAVQNWYTIGSEEQNMKKLINPEPCPFNSVPTYAVAVEETGYSGNLAQYKC